MQIKDQILTFSKLGDFLLDESNSEQLKLWSIAARNENAWFTEDNVKLSLKNIALHYLNKDLLEEFIEVNNPVLQYRSVLKNVGIVMAGNIPLVGFHDLLCVVLSGHRALIKLSSSDSVLMKALIGKLYEFDSDFRNNIVVADRLNEADALIATGSDNTAKHFDYYFATRPRIIRRNRTSIAILKGEESRIELSNLGNDIFEYFGLGCRNVSKLYVPKDYAFDKFFESIEYWSTIQLHHKYNNNYDYNKSIYLVNRIPHLDNGFLLLKEDEALVSPIAVCYFERYESEKHLAELIENQKDKIQCIVAKDGKYEGSFDFGKAQCPTLSDFADGVNTISFLKGV